MFNRPLGMVTYYLFDYLFISLLWVWPEVDLLLGWTKSVLSNGVKKEYFVLFLRAQIADLFDCND